ncbi:hypothetical protein FWD07_00480 [Candidatus Saccharibacteria bacterium]|nr:hypothetical protein [Candidatus Saccharibacteria bacterium]
MSILDVFSFGGASFDFPIWFSILAFLTIAVMGFGGGVAAWLVMDKINNKTQNKKAVRYVISIGLLIAVLWLLMRNINDFYMVSLAAAAVVITIRTIWSTSKNSKTVEKGDTTKKPDSEERPEN